MKKSLFIAIFSILHFASYGQTTAAAYCFGASTGTYSSISSTGTSITTGMNADDKTKIGIAIGFSFVFCGTTYTTLSASSNGWISLANSSSTTYDNDDGPSMIPSAGFLMPFWDDLSGTSGNSYYLLSGSSPNRVFTVEWNSWKNITGSGTGNFQVKLYEGTNVIQYLYNGSYTGNSATIGIAQSTSDYLVLNNGTTSATASSTAFNTGIGSLPTGGGTFTFTPNPNLSNFTSPSVVAGCPGGASTATVNSTSLGTGTFTVTYNLSGANSASAHTATLTMETSNGTFAIPAADLPNAGATTLTITGIQNAAGCLKPVSSSNTASFTVAAQPSGASLASSLANPSCTGGSMNLSVSGLSGGAGTTTYTWSGPGITTTTGTSSVSPSFAPGAGTGVYSVGISFSGAGCNTTSAATATYTVAAQPSIGTLTTPAATAFCTTPVQLTAGTVAGGTGTPTYTWSGPGIAATTGSSGTSPVFSPTVSVLSSGAYSVSLSYSGAGCVTATKATTSIYTVTPVPSISGVTTNSPLCTGATLSLTAGSPANVAAFSWAGPVAIAGNTTAAASVSPVTTGASGTYTLAINNGAGIGCAQTFTTSVTVSNAPSLSGGISNSSPVCEGGTLLLSSSGPSNVAGYTWAGPAAISSSTSANAGVPGIAAAGAGVYSLAVNNGTGPGCVVTYTTSVTVNVAPNAFGITGGGIYCAGGSGVAVGLSGSASGINYQLYKGATAIGSPVAGTGSAISFGLQTAAGTYTVLATNASTSCTNSMSGSASVVVSPIPNVYAITGGGSYCSGGSGTAVGLSGSDAGVSYQLYNGAATVGSAVPGTGGAINFGIQTVGSYSVMANPGSSCATPMSGTAPVVTTALPTAYAVTGGGGYCTGSAGVHIGLSSSATGVNYQLYNGGTAIGSMAGGTGAALDMGVYSVTGTYSVQATTAATGCTNAMTGTVSVSVNPLPAAFAVTGGGSYCSGGPGLAVGLAGSVTGVNYQLYNGAATVGSALAGTGSAIGFGTQSASGTYTVLATNVANSCSAAMPGNAVIYINPLPAAFTIGGGGAYCAGGAGVHVTLSNSVSGINYQLYFGSTSVATVAGAGSLLDFGLQTGAGTYTVAATNGATGCSSNMTGSATVSVNALPAVYTVTGGGAYCAGSSGLHAGLGGSATGVNYQLYNGALTVGSAIAGTGSAIDFGVVTTAGTYSVAATSTSTTCVANMAGNAVISISPLPVAYAVMGGGSFCAGGAGVAVGLGNSATGVNYQLYNGSTPAGSPVAGTGSNLSFGNQPVGGVYTVAATSTANGCSNAMTGSATITVNSLPVAYTVAGGGSYCAGGSGVHVTLSGSSAGVNYQLYNGSATASVPVAGTGAALDFGLLTATGTYTVQAINAATSCVAGMSGSVAISTNPLPMAYSVTGGGAYCAGAAAPAVGLSSSQTGVSYQLYNGSSPIGFPVAGTNSAISFGTQPAAGIYSVSAVNTTTTCISNMTGSVTVSVNAAPAIYTITGGGSYCLGGSGVHIGLSGSSSGVSYQLFSGSSPVGVPLTGTGGSLDFGVLSTVGTYSVQATNAATCQAAMSGVAVISTNPVPAIFAVTGGGAYCAGSAAPHVGLAGSAAGINYQLYSGSSTIGSAVAGTGSSLDFGARPAAGTYTVQAINAATGCTSNMSGNAGVTVNALPAVYAMTGGGSFCSGGVGVAMGLGGSATGFAYQLYNGSSPVTSYVTGTGAAIAFGNQVAAGTYTVQAMDVSSLCTTAMSGTAVVVVNPLPTAYSITGGGAYCSGGTGVSVGIASSATGISYQLYNGASPAGLPVTGTGSALSFGSQTAAGTYSVLATNSGTGCVRAMPGGTSVVVNSLPVAYAVTGGGNYCNGSAGVHVGLAGSEAGSSYQLYNGSTAIGAPLTGTNAVLDFGIVSASGTYSVIATNGANSCVNAMAGNVTVGTYPLPVVYAVTGGGHYCNGGTGVNVGVANSEAGVNYQLYYGAASTGSAVAGTGAAVSFGLQTMAGVYTVKAINATTGCNMAMGGSATVVIDALPALYTVTGGGSYCAGGNGVVAGLSGSDAGVNYQLYNSGAINTLSGTGASLNYGLQTSAGTYSVIATSQSNGCSRTMSGSAVVTVLPLPAPYAVGGGGDYCNGTGGVHVTIGGSAVGTNYQLFAGSTPLNSLGGTGASLDFGLQTMAGSYSVVATDAASSCPATMSGSATVAIDPLPAVYPVTGGGSYCAGGAGVVVSCPASETGIAYTLYENGTSTGIVVSGTGLPISFGTQLVAGTYTVVATNVTTGCTSNMTGNAIVVVNSLPATFAISAGGTYCAGGDGVDITLSGSATGIDYQLYKGATVVGAVQHGIGNSIDMGMQQVAGSYSILATNTGTGCVAAMSGVATININNAPLAYAVTGGGSYCISDTGVHVGVGSSDPAASYQLYNGATAVGASMTGTGAAIDFGLQTAAGNYTVVATETATGCKAPMSGSAVVHVTALPALYSVYSIGSSMCEGSAGVHVLQSGSETGVNYQMYRGSIPVGPAIAGTGGVLDFGAQTIFGAYRILATNTTTGCNVYMPGVVSLLVHPLPVQYAVGGGGNFCAGSGGVHVTLTGSDADVSYQLYNGATAIGGAIAGTGTMLDFGAQTGVGTYTVLATYTASGCATGMSGSAVVNTNLPPAVHNVTGGGNYCADGAGVPVGLDQSEAGVNYQLYNGSTPVGSWITSTGGPLDLGLQTAAGVYSVSATDPATICSSNMNGATIVGINPLPQTYVVTGGGNVCAGASGVPVGLGGSVSSIAYQLYKDGSPVTGATFTGTGDAFSMGLQTSAGSYQVYATDPVTSCGTFMTGSASVIVNTPPTAYTVTGGGNYCAGGTGVSIGLGNSASGVSYQLYNGSALVGSPITGTGLAVTFGSYTTAGTYTVQASDGATGCAAGMTGSATVGINPVQVPAVSVSTGIGDTVCLGTMITFTATPVHGGTSPVYTWTVNGGAVASGTTSFTYIPANGDVVSVSMLSNATCAIPAMATDTHTITATGHKVPAVTISSDHGDSICLHTTVTYTAHPSFGGSAPTFTWILNGAPVYFGTAYTYMPGDGDVLSCKMSSNFPCRLSDTGYSEVHHVHVDTSIAPVVTIAAHPGASIAKGQADTLVATVLHGGPAPVYQWYINNTGIFGATNAVYISNSFSNGDDVRCEVLSSGACAVQMGAGTISISVSDVGVAAATEEAISVIIMPNPNNGSFTVHGNTGKPVSGMAELEVTDMLGHTVHSGSGVVHNGVFDVPVRLAPELANGMYLLRIGTQAGYRSLHIMVSR